MLEWCVTEETVRWFPEPIHGFVRLGGELGNLGELNTIRPELRPKIPEMKAEIAKLKEELAKSDVPLTHAIIDAGVWIDGSDPTVTYRSTLCIRRSPICSASTPSW